MMNYKKIKIKTKTLKRQNCKNPKRVLTKQQEEVYNQLSILEHDNITKGDLK